MGADVRAGGEGVGELELLGVEHLAGDGEEARVVGALLEVQDDGPGIPPEEREKIFRPFYQARNNRTGTGIGIGLNLCRTLVDLLNGSIRADGRHDRPFGPRSL